MIFNVVNGVLIVDYKYIISNNKDIDLLVDHTVNTWQKERDGDEKKSDTISNYKEQINELFLKNPRRFPCESINLKKHFYSYVDENDLNRIILGYINITEFTLLQYL